MGANSSVPQTAEFTNPHMEANIITITQPVSNRIEKIRKQEDDQTETTQFKSTSTLCPNCAQAKEKQTEKSNETVLSAYQKKLLEIENGNFESKFKELENAIPKPINWSEETKTELKALESEILKCYKQYRGEPLHCYTNAKDFQNFIFDKQYKTILKHTQAAGDNENQSSEN